MAIQIDGLTLLDNLPLVNSFNGAKVNSDINKMEDSIAGSIYTMHCIIYTLTYIICSTYSIRFPLLYPPYH